MYFISLKFRLNLTYTSLFNKYENLTHHSKSPLNVLHIKMKIKTNYMQQSLKQQPRLKCKFCLVADASSTTEFVCTFTSPATVLIIRMAN